MKKFRLEEKLIASVKYYERMYVISDDAGDKIYLGFDKKIANGVLKALNGYTFRKTRKAAKRTLAKKHKRR